MIFFKKYSLLIAGIIMVTSAFSQIPSFDKINTDDGVVEMYFIGHASLMFKVNDFIIHLDNYRLFSSMNITHLI